MAREGVTMNEWEILELWSDAAEKSSRNNNLVEGEPNPG